MNHEIPVVNISYLSSTSTNFVALPEITYKLSVSKSKCLDLISSYIDLLNLPHYREDYFRQLIRNRSEMDASFVSSTKSIESLKKNIVSLRLASKLWSNKDVNRLKNVPWLLIAVISDRKGNDDGTIYGTLCQISNTAHDISNKSTTILTLKALGRCKINSANVDIFSKPSVAPVEIHLNENAYKMNTSDLASEFNSRVTFLFSEISRFTKLYSTALNSVHPNAYEAFLRLSPLAGVLHLLLSKSKSLDIVEKLFHALFDNSSDKKHIAVLMLKIYDYLVGLLPVSGSIKIDFLVDINSRNRLTKSGPFIIDNFIGLLKSFDNHFELIMKDFMTRDDNTPDKMKLVLNHVTTLNSIMSQNDNKNDGNSASEKVLQKHHSSGSSSSGEDDNVDPRFKDFYEKLIADPSPIKVPFEGAKLLRKDFEKYFSMASSSAKQNQEFQVLSNYLEVVVDLPWSIDENAVHVVDLKAAKEKLDNDHYGLYNVKNRLTEYLGVLNLQYKVENSKALNKEKSIIKPKAPIICLSGPPGVGKTSIAKSVAETLGRKFQRISLGGVCDEAEIRGHRRTYVGAMPGVIVSSMRKAKTLNPVILLDEIDKISSNGYSRGDPQAAMLEVLDPEQNSGFNDHYLGFPIDLSQALFFCTANDISRLHPALRDRMEIIYLTGYTFVDKLEIVKNHLLVKQMRRNWLPKDAIQVDDKTINQIIVEYTKSEAGIRNLERQISTLCRKKALEYSNVSKFDGSRKLPKGYNPLVTEDDLPSYLGIPMSRVTLQKSQPKTSVFTESYGVVNGLSYNSDGTGSTLLFEVVGVPNQGSEKSSVLMTGKLGEVLTESIKIAYTFVKLILSKRMIETSTSCEEAMKVISDQQLHLHAPEGAIPKDGPSAGIAITLALFSLVLRKPVASNIAMTGEMTLRGIVLPIGGVKQKILGAHLSGTVDTVIVPRQNRTEIIEYYMSNLNLQDKTEESEKLKKILRSDQKNAHNVNVYEDPEKHIKKSLGIKVYYAEDFWDVLKCVWGDEVRIFQKAETKEAGLRPSL